MRSGLILFSLVLSVNLIAATNKELICNDQNGHAVYGLKLENDNLELKALIKDSSTLSKSDLILRFEEGESTEKLQVFTGKNKERKDIVAILSVDQVKNLKRNQIIEVEMLYSQDSRNLDQKTTLLCSEN